MLTGMNPFWCHQLRVYNVIERRGRVLPPMTLWTTSHTALIGLQLSSCLPAVWPFVICKLYLSAIQPFASRSQMRDFALLVLILAGGDAMINLDLNYSFLRCLVGVIVQYHFRGYYDRNLTRRLHCLGILPKYHIRFHCGGRELFRVERRWKSKYSVSKAFAMLCKQMIQLVYPSDVFITML